MTIGSITPGRLPLSLISRRNLQYIDANAQSLAKLQQQVASGQRITLPSEDPSAAFTTVLLQSILERKEQIHENLQTDESFLAATESAMSTVSDALSQAKSFALAGIGNTYSLSEKQGMAVEVGSLLEGVLNAANTQFRGRYLFGGTYTDAAPFDLMGNGTVKYSGDTLSINSFADIDLLMANNVDGDTAFAALTDPVGDNINPALTLATKVDDLYRGAGVSLGSITVSLDNGGTPQTATVDLSGVKTVGDIKTRLENAFSGGPLTLTVDINPTTQSGLRLTPSAGTVSVTDLSGSRVAADLGIAGGPAAQIAGSDLDAALTIHTRLSDLNGGAGIDQTNGLVITNGSTTFTVDLTAAQTVEDVFNAILAADSSLSVGINTAKDGFAISSRLSGAQFSIGENGGTTAADLGIRTFDGSTLLADLNRGLGVAVDSGASLEITRRDSSTVSVDLSGTRTVQDVLDAINAVDPGNLVASLNSVGNGISLLDNSGTGPLAVAENSVGTELGLAGQEASGNPANPLIGEDSNPQETTGVLSILAALETALDAGDDAELQRLAGLIDTEIDRFNLVRADVGARLKLVEDIETRVLDQEVDLKEQLSEKFDADLTEVLTELLQQQQALEATLQIAAQSLNLSLLSYL